MQLKEEVSRLLVFHCAHSLPLLQFRSYECLRREHDGQIIRMAMEAGLRISPEQWSTQLYGDHKHKSDMQSIIDKVRC